jgi:hypothetical protein
LLGGETALGVSSFLARFAAHAEHSQSTTTTRTKGDDAGMDTKFPELEAEFCRQVWEECEGSWNWTGAAGRSEVDMVSFEGPANSEQL